MPYLPVNGTELFYQDEGTGQPLLFLHGNASSGRVWGAQVVDFVRDHRVVTLDWRGCGRSAHPATGNTIADNVSDIIAVIDALELAPVVLIGSSIGGTFATEVALRAPERVAGIVGVDAPGYWAAQGMTEQLAELRVALRADRATTVANWVPNWYGPGVGPAMAEWTIRQYLDSGVYIDDLLTEHASYDPRPALPSLTVPAAFLHGRLDAEIPVAVAETCAALVPHGEVRVIEGAGHMPHQEKPEQFNAALREVLADWALPADGAVSPHRIVFDVDTASA